MKSILYSMVFVSTFALAQGATTGVMQGGMNMPNLPNPAAMSGYGQQGYGQQGMAPQMGAGQMGAGQMGAMGMQQGAQTPYLGFAQPDQSSATQQQLMAQQIAAQQQMAGQQQGFNGVGETFNQPNVLCDGIINGSVGPTMGPLNANSTASSSSANSSTSGRHTN